MYTYKKTSENWCGNYGKNKDLAKVSFFDSGMGFDPVFGCFCRIMVSGNDDTMMNLDFPYTNEETKRDAHRKALKVYFEVLKIEDLTFDKLIEKGFEWF